MAGQKDLLFPALNDGCGVEVVGFFEFLAGLSHDISIYFFQRVCEGE